MHIARLRGKFEPRSDSDLAVHQLKGAAGSDGFETLTPALRRLDHSVRMSSPDAELLNAIVEVTELCSRARGAAPE